MNIHSYEIEIKSLLGSKDQADELKRKMREQDSALELLETSSQLNHYFVGGSLKTLFENTGRYIEPGKLQLFESIASQAQGVSVRTRETEGKIILVIKASVDSDTSANSNARMEFESVTPELSLEKLDKLVLDSGFEYQAKWSRTRETYRFLNTTVCLDKNAGYGYLAEFELLETDPEKVDAAKAKLRSLMHELGVDELPQDRLERMFAYYNEHWRDYYGTDNVFTVS